jgi:hypothetical protein
LQEIDADPRAIEKLTSRGNSEVGELRMNVKAWESARTDRLAPELWRLRVLDTAATNYRVVYGYHWQTQQICVLAVVHKEDFDYDDHESHIAQRILADWENLGS